MDESPDREPDTDDGHPEATDEDVETAVGSVETESGERVAGPSRNGAGASGADSAAGVDPSDLPDEVLNAPTKAEEGEHTLLEEYERANESRWRSGLRTGAFWAGATVAAVAVTLTAVVSLRQSGLSDGVAFVLASVGMAVMVGFVFLSLRR